MWCLGLLVAFYCPPPEPPRAPTSTYCQIAQPVRPSRADTQRTKVQAAREFGKWKKACAGKKEART